MNELKSAAALMGAKGGAAGTGKAKARTKAQCRRAALARWAKYRAQKKVEKPA